MPVESTMITMVTLILPIAGALFASAMTVRIALATIRANHTAQKERLKDHVKNTDAHVTRDFMVDMDKRFSASEKQSREHTEAEVNKVLSAIRELRQELKQMR